MKRPIFISCSAILLFTFIVYYRYSLFAPSRPSGIPTDAFPCRFGFTLHWGSIGSPGSHDLLDGALLKLYDRHGKLLMDERVALATPPRLFDSSSARGCESYPDETLRTFEIPPDKMAAGSHLGSYVVIQLDSDKALVPWWIFK